MKLMVDKAESLNYTFGKSGAAARGHAGRLHILFLELLVSEASPGTSEFIRRGGRLNLKRILRVHFYDYH